MSQQLQIDVSGTNLVVRQVALDDQTPTGAQISASCGYASSQQITVLQWTHHGDFEDISPNEPADLTKGTRFIVTESDGSSRLTIDGRRIDWPEKFISGAILRQLGRVDPAKAIYFERQDEPDQLLSDEQIVNLGKVGVEAFYSRAETWILNVQGIRIEFGTPIVIVSAAMEKAGFDVQQGWHIYLKVQGQPKKEMALTDTIDLSQSGIEKLRLVPKDVTNGEVFNQSRYQFALQENDERFLDQRFASWETIIENGQRWLLISGYKLPSGYMQCQVTMAFEIPPAYPGAQIDMFYVHPPIVLQTGQSPPATEVRVNIAGSTFQRWSRHRGAGAPWKPETDNVITHLALVESALVNEVT